MANLINWAEVSRILTADRPKGGDRKSVGKNYAGKKYKIQVARIKMFERKLEQWLKATQKK